MKLYEINREIESCIKMDDGTIVGGATGEIIDIDRLNELKMERHEKIKNIALWVKDLRAEAEALKAEKKAFEFRQRQAEVKAESLKNYLSVILNGEKFKDDKVSISFRKTPSTVVLDEKRIPDKWWKAQKPVLDRAEAMKALKNGKEIPGMALEIKKSIQIK